MKNHWKAIEIWRNQWKTIEQPLKNHWNMEKSMENHWKPIEIWRNQWKTIEKPLKYGEINGKPHQRGRRLPPSSSYVHCESQDFSRFFKILQDFSTENIASFVRGNPPFLSGNGISPRVAVENHWKTNGKMRQSIENSTSPPDSRGRMCWLWSDTPPSLWRCPGRPHRRRRTPGRKLSIESISTQT